MFEHLTKDMRMEVLNDPSVTRNDAFAVSVVEDSWMTPLFNFLKMVRSQLIKLKLENSEPKPYNIKLREVNCIVVRF